MIIRDDKTYVIELRREKRDKTFINIDKKDIDIVRGNI